MNSHTGDTAAPELLSYFSPIWQICGLWPINNCTPVISRILNFLIFKKIVWILFSKTFGQPGCLRNQPVSCSSTKNSSLISFWLFNLPNLLSSGVVRKFEFAKNYFCRWFSILSTSQWAGFKGGRLKIKLIFCRIVSFAICGKRAVERPIIRFWWDQLLFSPHPPIVTILNCLALVRTQVSIDTFVTLIYHIPMSALKVTGNIGKILDDWVDKRLICWKWRQRCCPTDLIGIW